MLDPEGDRNPTLPGDGGAPPVKPVCMSTQSVTLEFANSLERVGWRFRPKTGEDRDFAKKYGTPQALIREAIADLLDKFSLSIRFPEQDSQRDKVSVALTALRAIVLEAIRECPVCNDVGAIRNGERCPTGCDASQRWPL